MEFKKKEMLKYFFSEMKTKNPMNNMSTNLVNTEKKEVKVAVF